MILEPRVGGILLLMIGFLAAWNTIIPAMAIGWICAGGWHCGVCGEFNQDNAWLCRRCGAAR